MTIFDGLTGGWAVVLVLVVDIVRVGADEVKTTLDSLAAATSSARGAALVKVFGKKNQGLGQGLGLARIAVASSARGAAPVIVGWVVIASSRWSKALSGWADAVLVLIFGAAAESCPMWTDKTVTSVTTPCLVGATD